MNDIAQEDFIYFDNNSTTRVDPRVIEAMLPYFTELYGNASSSHRFGIIISHEIKQARIKISELLNCDFNDLIFTSGATESINLLLKGFALQNQNQGKHIITVQTEHKAVLETCEYLESIGFDISYLPVDKNGLIQVELLKSLIRHDTILVSVMWVNNEIGTIQSIDKIANITQAAGVTFFTDATQAVGKIPIDLNKSRVDFMAFSGHKFYAPKGVGILYVRELKRKSQKLKSLIHGGDHENGLRSGTLNVPGIIGLGKASEIAKLEMEEDSLRIGSLRNRLENELLKLPFTFVNGISDNRIFNVSNICFPGIDADVFIGQMNNIALSNGSACTSSLIQPSHVLKAIGLTDDEAFASIRFSLGRFNKEKEVDTVINVAKEIILKTLLKHA